VTAALQQESSGTTTGIKLSAFVVHLVSEVVN